MLEERPANGRLDSWKEIAAYLNRDVRTVIRWENKGLPVHRVPGGKRQAVFAYTAEIDGWLSGHPSNENHAASPPRDEGGGQLKVQEAGPAGPDAAATSQTHSSNFWPVTPFARYGWKLSLAGACLVGLIWIMGAVLAPSHTSAPVHPLSLKQLTDDGRAKAYLRTDGTKLYFTETEGARSVLASAPVSGGPVQVIDTPFSNVVLQDLSRDGKTLLLSSYEGILLEGPLWTIPTQGGAPQRIGQAACKYARWSPDNRKIVCAEGTTITLMDADGSNLDTIESSSSPVGPVSWSPDGSRLRYVVEDTAAHIFSQRELKLQPGGSSGSPSELDFGPTCCVDWTWTADGREFVYADYAANGRGRLMTQPAGASRSTELPVNIGTLFGIASGESSKALYLDIANAYRGELLKFNARQKTFQTFLPGVSASFVAFSPDGKWITYTNTQDSSLWRSRADGSDAFQLAKAPMQVQVSSWSPDGREIAFMGQAPGKPWRIFLIGHDGGPAREASEGNDNQGGPSFSPDGKAMVYGNVFCEETQNCWIRHVDLATGKTHILPGSNGLRTARWSPDGKYIAALRFQTREVVLFDVKEQRWQRLAGSVAGDNINWSSDSRYIYVDNPRETRPVVERIRIKDGRRSNVVSLASLQNVPGTISPWFGLAPDNSPILAHMFGSSEIYALDWAEK